MDLNSKHGGAISVGYAEKGKLFNEILAFFEILNVD